MIRAERFHMITNLSNEVDIITLEHLAERLNVSIATVRRDVEELCAQGIVEKTRGGIIFCNKTKNTEPSLQLRQLLNTEEKKRIAQAAFRHIREHSYYLFDSGSTIHELLKLIPTQFPLSIVTYDLTFLPELNALECADVLILGGQLRRGQMACHGSYAENYLDQLNAHIAFLGADAVDLNKGIMGFHAGEVPLKQKMIANADQTILLCDHSKFYNRGFISIHGLKGIDRIITDSGTDAGILQSLRDSGIEVEVV